MSCCFYDRATLGRSADLANRSTVTPRSGSYLTFARCGPALPIGGGLGPACEPVRLGLALRRKRPPRARKSRRGAILCREVALGGPRGPNASLGAALGGEADPMLPPPPNRSPSAPSPARTRNRVVVRTSPWGLRGPHRAALWNWVARPEALSSLRRVRLGKYAELLHRLTHISRRGWATGPHSLGACRHTGRRAQSPKKKQPWRGVINCRLGRC